MNPQDHIPSLHAPAAIMLPGMRHARALLDVSIRVLEYFDRHAARDAAIEDLHHLHAGAAEPAEGSGEPEVDAIRFRAAARKT